ncbi:MAG TPA: hypothetical protein PK095_23575 [Myxococcota bacterium]|nr:hypothetical protein [Myxococcota bacterium]
MKKYALALATVAPFALAGTANAKDVGGKFGLGGEAFGGGAAPAGLSLKYWISDLGLQANLGLGINTLGPDTTHLGLGFHVLYNFARANDTNMYASGGINLGLIDSDSTVVALRLGVEHFFTDHFSVGGHVGLGIDVGGDDVVVNLGNSSEWGTSFHFYF